jgi:hypothetical protein
MTEHEVDIPARNRFSPTDDPQHDEDEHRPKRAQIQELIDGGDGQLGYDDNGCYWLAKIREDGSQIWLSSYNGYIRSCGTNPPSILCDIGLKLLKPGSKTHERYIKDLKDPYKVGIMKSMIPQHITIGSAPHLLSLLISNFLLNYNIDLQSEEINLLKEELAYGEQIPEVHELLCEMAYTIPIRFNSVGAVVLHKLLGVKIGLRFDTYDFYMATVCFLEKYGKRKGTADVIILGSELGQFHIAQWIYKKWENCMVWALNRVGVLEEEIMHDVEKWHGF